MTWAATTTLSDVCESVRYGYTASASPEPCGPHFLRITDIVPDSLNWDSVPFCKIEDKDKERFSLSMGDIVVARTGATVGYAKLIREPVDSVFASYLVRFRVDPGKADRGFMGRLVESSLYKAFIKSRIGGAAQSNASAPVLGSFEFPLPSKPEQVRISDILSAYDDLIENNRRRIALLEKAARLLYREWFVHFRFPGHEHVKIIDGLLEEWKMRTLGDIVITNRDSYRAKELPDELNYIDISSVAQGRILSKNPMASTEAPGRARRKARDGDVIWSNVRPNLRAYALILEPDQNDVFSTGFTVLSATEVPFTWLYLLVTTDQFVGHLVNHATGAGYPAVRPDDFERAAIALPPTALLNLFHESTDSNFRLVSKLEQQNQKLSQARDLLLPRLMNGEIAV